MLIQEVVCRVKEGYKIKYSVGKRKIKIFYANNVFVKVEIGELGNKKEMALRESQVKLLIRNKKRGYKLEKK